MLNLSSEVSLDVQISDDEAPVKTITFCNFSLLETEIPENNGSTVH